MWSNYFKIACRTLSRYWTYSLLNIGGLSLSLAFAVLMGLWINHELSFDAYHEGVDRMFEVVLNDVKNDVTVMTFRSSAYPMAEAIEEQIPEVEGVANYTWSYEQLVTYDNKKIKQKGLHGTASMFEIFSFPLIQGNPKSIFEELNTVVVSKSMAEKTFGKYWGDIAIGSTIKVENETDFIVTGVFEDIKENNSEQFDFLMNLEELKNRYPENLNWTNLSSNTVIKLNSLDNKALVEQKISKLIADNCEWNGGKSILQPYLNPLKDRYLYSKFENGVAAPGRIKYVRIFSGAAIMLLLIAFVNFINLTIARASKRAKEVGVRKAVGANKWNLIKQFFVESTIISAISIGLAILITELFLPIVSNLTDKDLFINYTDPLFLLSLIVLVLTTIVLSGSYPAFALSSFRINNVLKGRINLNTSNAKFGKGLVVFQFTLSTLLISCAVITQMQIHFLKNKNLGLNKAHIAILHINPAMEKDFEIYKRELEKQVGIESVTISNTNPIKNYNATWGLDWPGKDPDEQVSFATIFTDDVYKDMMGLTLIEGRNLDRNLITDSSSIMLNRTAAEKIGIEDIVGKQIKWGEENELTVVGIVEDFHFRPLHMRILPLFIGYKQSKSVSNCLLVKIEASNTELAMQNWESTYSKFSSDYPFEYEFLDESFNKLYKNETLTGKLANYFAIMAIFISCLGLLGLSTFAAEQRIKEIGIRKVLGASVTSIITLLSKEFILLVGIALLIASPLAWIFMQNWLESFAYHIELKWWIFGFTCISAIVIAIATIATQAIRAALSNPINSLKSE